MNQAIIWINFLRALAMASGSDRIAEATVTKWLNLAGDLISTSTEYTAVMQSITAQIQQMVNENRDPTPQEFASLRELRHQLSDRIQNPGVDA